MSTPQSQLPKGPRRSTRRSKDTIPNYHSGTEQGFPYSGIPPPESDLSISVSVNSPAPRTGKQDGGRRKSQTSKNSQNIVRPDRTLDSHSVPVPSHTGSPPQQQATPNKQAYAGPTFHSSPAPSKLPIPSFYSKSLPISAPPRSSDTNDVSGGQHSEITESLESLDATTPQQQRESTPLDFLFEAARQARDTPRGESPTSRSVNISAFGDSPLSRSPAPRNNSHDMDFPFELDGNGSDFVPIGHAFATPYRKRLESLRLANSQHAPPEMQTDGDECKSKTEALKKLLLKPNTTPPLAVPTDANNPFNARTLDHQFEPSRYHLRQRSGPSLSSPPPSSNGRSGPQYVPTGSLAGPLGRPIASPVHRPASSSLRREYQMEPTQGSAEVISGGMQSHPLISTARKHHQHSDVGREDSLDASTSLTFHEQSMAQKPTRSSQSLEDDLRRVLNINLTSKG